MKRCPQCGAEYDDYVQYCFVDGAELAAAAAAAPEAQAKPPRTATPVPAAGPATRAAPAVVPVVRPPPPPPEPGRSSTLWAVLVLMLLGVALFAFLGLGGVVIMLGSRPDGPSAERPAPARPVEVPPPPPPSPKPASAIVRVRFESTPPGAAVWEADRFLCTTPCDVEHPDYAPPQRSFVLKLDGYSDEEHVMTDPTAVQQVVLKGGGGRQKARPRPNDEILIER